MRILPYENAYFFTFLKIWKTGNFERGISPWKRRLQKKRSTPQRRQRKMQENCHLRFFIFELSSQRFFDLKLAIFRFFKNSKKRKFWRFWPQNCGCFLNTPIKVNRWKTLLGPCTSKLILSIFFVGRFVLAQFWAIALIISWSVKKLIFWWKFWKRADYVSVISPWKQSPQLKFWGPKRTSGTGQEDGWWKKQKKSFLRSQYCRTKTPIFRFFWKFVKLAILIGKDLYENSVYRKNRVYHDKGNGNCKKTVISDFLFLNFRHRDFLI